MIFTKKNYRLAGASFGVLLLGYTVMALDPTPQGLGTLGLTVGPLVLMVGIVGQFWAIMAVGLPTRSRRQVGRAAASANNHPAARS
ncbi:MAG: hypothetical protein WBA12_12010 [Catalinimonas sp.]